MFLIKIKQGQMLLDFDVTDDIVVWEATTGAAILRQFKGAKFTVYDLGMGVVAIVKALTPKPKARPKDLVAREGVGDDV